MTKENQKAEDSSGMQRENVDESTEESGPQNEEVERARFHRARHKFIGISLWCAVGFIFLTYNMMPLAQREHAIQEALASSEFENFRINVSKSIARERQEERASTSIPVSTLVSVSVEAMATGLIPAA